MTESEARYLMQALRPYAKFGAYAHSDQFLDLEAQIGKGFFYVNIYDENINANLLDSKKGVILLSNSYLSSAAYNILLAWLFESKQKGILERINPLVKYNIKKFFAEQLLHFNNNVFSRAIFLETLLYEEHQMRLVIAASEAIEEWKSAANGIAAIMGNLIMFHESGHYYRKYLPDMFNELMNHDAEVTIPFLSEIAKEFPAAFVEEVRCDLFSVLFCLVSIQNDSIAQTFILRAAVLGYNVFSLLWSLRMSAEATATEHQKQPDDIELISFEKSSREYTYFIGRDEVMIMRAKLITVFCEKLAEKKRIELYGEDGVMPLQRGSLEYFLAYLEVIMETEQNHHRLMARLVAESLHNHPDGLQYLYLHSKVFKAERPLIL